MVLDLFWVAVGCGWCILSSSGWLRVYFGWWLVYSGWWVVVGGVRWCWVVVGGGMVYNNPK